MITDKEFTYSLGRRSLYVVSDQSLDDRSLSGPPEKGYKFTKISFDRKTFEKIKNEVTLLATKINLTDRKFITCESDYKLASCWPNDKTKIILVDFFSQQTWVQEIDMKLSGGDCVMAMNTSVYDKEFKMVARKYSSLYLPTVLVDLIIYFSY